MFKKKFFKNTWKEVILLYEMIQDEDTDCLVALGQVAENAG